MLELRDRFGRRTSQTSKEKLISLKETPLMMIKLCSNLGVKQGVGQCKVATLASRSLHDRVISID